MTHDELLAEIELRQGMELGLHAFKAWVALRAVVELHKPSLGGACSHCSTTTFWTVYSCPTIQAIEEQLK